ncbi:MAG: carbohydrate kinase [Roseibium sp.]|uniref:carbohydrate kinase family protein n=1 Tax=Roseibium sp. TaxID=1936156 RepID=UPI00262249B4|nr:PfkB family carbohydrate kinase [Roseibium sp.]MCV0426973.1 carbohydrate kinase [Roseibium sp.]
MLHRGDKPVILSAGRIYCDLVFADLPRMPTLGSETFAGGVSLHAGGGAFNSAVAFSVLGWSSALLGTLPAAPFDKPVLDEGRALGLDLSLCLPAPAGSAPQITVAMALQNDRSFLSHKAGSAFPVLDANAPVCRSVRHLHIGELKSLCEEPGLIVTARKAGWSVSLDCGWDDDLLRNGNEVAEFIAAVDVFLPNESEYAALRSSGLPEHCCAVTVVKEGSAGARALAKGKTIHRPSFPANVVDTTGAGDAFNGGFLSAWLAGEDLATCLENGNRCGAMAVKHAGGTSGMSLAALPKR